MVTDINDITRASLLYDFYGALLTEKQRSVMALYHEENLTLAEIADEYGISRQAVHDTLKKAEQALADYESKLNLVGKLARTEDALTKLRNELALIEQGQNISSSARAHIKRMKDIMNSLED